MRVTDYVKEEQNFPDVYVEFRPAEKEIFARCKKDQFNEPALYTTTKRSVKKLKAAYDAIVVTAPHLTGFCFKDVQSILTEHGISYHYWCMVD